jgi:hypothetical protein
MRARPQAREGDGDEVITGRYPVINLADAFELYSMLGITIPGTESDYEEHDGQRTAWLLHPDGSWARATANDRPDVPPGRATPPMGHPRRHPPPASARRQAARPRSQGHHHPRRGHHLHAWQMDGHHGAYG